MHFGEVDEISDEDLEATADYYQCILNETLPHKQAERIASEHYGVVLDDTFVQPYHAAICLYRLVIGGLRQIWLRKSGFAE